MHARFVVIGGGLSGLAAAIRLARFDDNVLLIEKHSRVGGLNSYYYRHNRLIETGLHAITNYTERSQKQAPFNKLLRQLKIRREEIGMHQQWGSAIHFPGHILRFSNDFNELKESVHAVFGQEIDGFTRLVAFLDQQDPFRLSPFQSTRQVIGSFLKDKLLTDMLLCPICYYGSSVENDIDLHQFVIMFRSIFQEGFFRPRGTIKDLLDLLTNRFQGLGGTLRLKTSVSRMISENSRIVGLTLDNGETISCDHVLSTIGLEETRNLLADTATTGSLKRLAFSESIFVVDKDARDALPAATSCIFFNNQRSLAFRQPTVPVDFSSGVISLPFNFQGWESPHQSLEIRTTHLANYQLWQAAAHDPVSYRNLKEQSVEQSRRQAELIVGKFSNHLLFHDSFTPLTIERFTGKREGAIYGSPVKVKDGKIGYENLFLAGTDQGFLGIVGSMLSGVSMVNEHLLMKTQPSA